MNLHRLPSTPGIRPAAVRMDEVGITCIAGMVADCETEVAMFEHEWNYISLCFIV